jgi:penicillin-binding protein 1C
MDPVLTARRLRRNRRHKKTNWFFRILGALLAGVIALAVLIGLAGMGTLVGVYAYYAKDLPDPQKIESVEEQFKTTRLYDRTGQHLLYEIFDPHRGDRTIVPLEDIPLWLRQATIASEDRSFYQNIGINPRGLVRAFWSNLQGGDIQGGSSITQQLVKMVLIPAEERYQKLYSRKIKEIILALEITRRYPGKAGKDAILEWYLNTIPYGNLAYGAEAASQVYFNKHVQELTLAEAATLAAIPQFPGLNPIDAPEQAKKRRDLVLDAMLRDGYITEAEAEAAKREELVSAKLHERFDIKAPHFSMYVRKQLEEQFGMDMVYQGGLKVYTTLDMNMQTIAEKAIQDQLKVLKETKDKETGKPHNVSNAALVAIRPQTGEILAMVGSADYWNEEIDGNVNVALAERQPGSAFKVFTYLTAFAQGHTAAEMILDVRTCPNPEDPSWCPENYDRKYHGAVRARQALARSYNIAAVKMLDMAGVGNVIKTAHRMGINSLNRDLDYYGLSLTLGGGEVRLLDLTYAYGVLANKGVMAGKPVPLEQRRPGYRELDPVAILRVEDSNGNVLWDYRYPENRTIVSPQLAYLITDILADNAARAAAFGSNSKLKLTRPAAAKTGTTNNYKDAWTIGYTPQLVAGVWVGNSNNEPMSRVAGSLGAAPIWNDFMEGSLANEPVIPFERPDGLQTVEVCAVSGLLPTENCPQTVREIFLPGTAPTTYCNVHQKFRVNRETGKLATIYTPPELVEERVYEIFPPEATDYLLAENIPQPPTEYDDIAVSAEAVGDLGIISPTPYAYIKGVVPITGTVRPPDLQLWRLEYGQGLNPSAWIQIGGDYNHPVDNGYLETWDVSQLEGLYTLQLSAIDNAQNVRQSTIQVTVDNVPPLVKVGHPEEGKVYIKEEDEYVNIQADVKDNVSIKLVEFYVDEQKVASTSTAPFNEKWPITMLDIVPEPDVLITRTEVLSIENGIVYDRVITLTETITNIEGLTLTQVFSDGMMVISDTMGITESHVIYVKAFDAAGNESQSEKVHIWVAHEKKKEDEEKKEQEGAETTALLPPNRSDPAARAGLRRTARVGSGWVTPIAALSGPSPGARIG